MRIRKTAAKKDLPLQDNIAELCLRSFIEGAEDPIIFLDTHYRYISYNSIHASTMEQSYGVKIEPGRSFLDCITVKENRDLAKSHLDQVLRTGEKLVIETLTGDEKLSQRYLRVTHLPVIDEKGTVTGVAMTAHDITEHKVSSELITASETRYRELFDHIMSCVAVYEAVDNGNDFIFRDINRAACATERVKREEVVGRSVRQVFPGVESFGLFKVFQRVWQTGQPEEFPIAQYKDDRISGWRENYIYKLPSGEVVTVYSDVTERQQTLEKLKLANEASKASEQAYRDIFESAPIGILHVTADGKLLNANLALARMVGYDSVDEFAAAVRSLRSGESFFVNPAQRAEILASMVNVTGWKQYEVEYKRRDGNIITCLQLMRTVTHKDGSIDRLEIFIEDITVRKQALQALERQREEYRTIFDSVPAAVAYIDSQGTFMRVNQPAAAALGYTPAQLVGKNLTDVFLPDDAAVFKSMHQEVLTTGLPLTGSINSYTTHAGEIKWSQNDVVPYLNVKGEIIGVIFLSEDVTERIKAEHGLRLSHEALNRALEGSVDALPRLSRYATLILQAIRHG